MPPTVTVFSKPKCVQCDGTYRAMDKRGIAYTVVDVTQDPEAADKVRNLGYMQAPVVLVDRPGDPEHWSGFRPDRISALAKEVGTASNDEHATSEVSGTVPLTPPSARAPTPSF